MTHPRVGALLLLLTTAVSASPNRATAEELKPRALPAAPPTVDFRKDIYPLLYARCFKCHKGADASAGYRLDDREEILGRGETNARPLAVEGDSGKSRLIRLVTATKGRRMPPKEEGEPLTAAEVKTLRAWIDQGLRWDDALLPPLKAQKSHWAFQPVAAPHVPRVKNAGWVRTPVDAFIAARHEAQGLVPSPEAPRQVLMRRLTLDLTGLPPTPEQVEAFVADPAPDAYERLVERLLASPQYGERWGRHWLDLARWADSEGYEHNKVRHSAWRYRDYVVASFNRDKPYDQFLREQLAGDELVPYSDENLIATGFLAAARLSLNEQDHDRQRNDVLVDIVNATAGVTLGLTLGCAQCHDHKFDPLTQQDYYRFQGFFVNGQPGHLILQDPEQQRAYEAATRPEREVLQAARQLDQLLHAPVRARLAEEVRQKLAPDLLRALNTPADRRTAEQEQLARKAQAALEVSDQKLEQALEEKDRRLFRELRNKIAQLGKELRDKRPQTWGYYSPAMSPHRVEVLVHGRKTADQGDYFPYEPEQLKRARPRLLKRGDVHQPGDELKPGWPEVLGPTPEVPPGRSARLALVEWLTSPTNPLVARVWANYLWQQHFGRGLVATPEDFGVRGARPTHPELLDWLAGELVHSGWSTKHLHRLLVRSSTYRQATRPTDPKVAAANEAAEPDNTAWWRWSPRRLEAEVIRDAIVFVSGELVLTPGGPSAAYGASAAADGGKLDSTDQESDLGTTEAPPRPRRSLYLRQLRDNWPVMQKLFDGVSTNESCARRHVSTVAPQPLYLLNNPFILKQAEAFAARVCRQAGADESRQIDAAFALALGRPPEEAERDAVCAFLATSRGAETPSGGGITNGVPNRPPLRLVHLCHTLLNLNEFVYLP